MEDSGGVREGRGLAGSELVAARRHGATAAPAPTAIPRGEGTLDVDSGGSIPSIPEVRRGGADSSWVVLGVVMIRGLDGHRNNIL